MIESSIKVETQKQTELLKILEGFGDEKTKKIASQQYQASVEKVKKLKADQSSQLEVTFSFLYSFSFKKK